MYIATIVLAFGITIAICMVSDKCRYIRNTRAERKIVHDLAMKMKEQLTMTFLDCMAGEDKVAISDKTSYIRQVQKNLNKIIEGI